MKDGAEDLERIFATRGEHLLQGNESITYKQAVDKATSEYRTYKTKILSDVEMDHLESIKMLEQRTKK